MLHSTYDEILQKRIKHPHQPTDITDLDAYIISISGGGDKNVDGGDARSIYLPTQLIDGGNA